MTDKKNSRKADSMVLLARDTFIPADDSPAVAAEMAPPAPRTTGDKVTAEGARRLAHSERDFAGLDFTVPADKRVNAPESSRTFGYAKSCEPTSANHPNEKRAGNGRG